MTITGYASFLIVSVVSFIIFLQIRSYFYLNFVYDKNDAESYQRYIDEKLSSTPWFSGITFAYLLNIVAGFFLSGASFNEIGNDFGALTDLAAIPTYMLNDFLTKMLFG